MSGQRPSWDEYFLGLVDAVAARATCNRGRSGAVFVRDRDIVATGYVGAPPGLPHCDDIGHLLDATGRHCVRTLHAEQNAVIRAARNGIVLKDTTAYTTMEPCPNCAMTLIGIGVYRVVSKHAYHNGEAGGKMLRASGIFAVTLVKDELYES